ncbi:HAMP domain-containing sensor histidine kinase [Paenibacillus sp. FSL R7-0048]|uniref:histidine kinase n=1 Tax=Paenibacillus odorifer TaxID=189426 RepID=A0ABX3GYK4_9BACL|nr:HAMP domain-containing sensor histidine kinase [Paenibacillus odorifer]OMC70095.1 two-component sensor histidine kinase [Paenibacillus odorifer]OMD40606.1 two-component sensor histidine kinase [Paenibacillus odorifer]OMD85471.1 two-component sensor histidine kinase [Paenibacillus odorifer]OMD96684.1 two-component sensor histidine kinase [Paenibacillus odorifer]
MKQTKSLFRRFLKGHFLFIFLPPIVLIFLSAFIASPFNEEELNKLNYFYIVLLVFGFIIVAFVVISWIFFLRLRKRLTCLQEVMSFSANHNSFPKPIAVQSDRMDEIDQLGSSFNWMIQQLEDSRKREHEEELLRHRLIANLSHDLRTPLTILRGHVTRLNKESMSLEGQNSLSEMNHTITRVGDLMDDLLSYTLLTSGKHPFEPTSTDIGRLVRASVAAWYPVFEEKEIRIEVDLPTEKTFYWEADPKWMTRVLDNLFQNILRHAAEGKYVNIVVDVEKEQIIVADRGPGMDNSSYERGAGIGLSTSNYMLNKMKLKADFTSNENGTTVAIGRA